MIMMVMMMMMMMMMMIIITIIIIIIIITTTTIIIITIPLKGAIRDFLQSLHCAANSLHHVRSCVPRCNRVQISCST